MKHRLIRVLSTAAFLAMVGSTVPARAQMFQPAVPLVPQSGTMNTFRDPYTGNSTTFFSGSAGMGTANTFTDPYTGNSTTFINGPGLHSGTINTFRDPYTGNSTSFFNED
jgi:hypothetical protein